MDTDRFVEEELLQLMTKCYIIGTTPVIADGKLQYKWHEHWLERYNDFSELYELINKKRKRNESV